MIARSYCDETLPNSRRQTVNMPVFMFVYIHFNVPQTRITDLVRNVSDEKIIIWNIHFVCRYVFAFINLVCVQSVIRLMNALLLLYYYKRLFHFFFKSDYCPIL